MSSHFSRTVRLPVPAAEAFAWHERPGAFERLAPPWQRVAVLESDHALRDGARVRLRARVAPPALAPLFPVVDPLLALAVPDEWVVEHRDYVPGRQFRDVMLRGPFASWTHLHRVEPDGPGASRLTDVVDYALPFGAAGRTLGGAFAGRELDRLFAFRHAVTAADLARHADARARGVAPLTVAVTGASGLVFEPRRIGCPAQYRLSLTVNGSPSAIPLGAPLAQRASDSPAALRAASGSTMQKALIVPL